MTGAAFPAIFNVDNSFSCRNKYIFASLTIINLNENERETPDAKLIAFVPARAITLLSL